MALPFAHSYAMLLFAATSTKKTSSSSELVFILILLAAGAYLWMRPQRRRLREQQMAQRDVEVGDEVVTASGIIGRVNAFVGNRVELEVAPGTMIEVMRQTVARRAEPNVVYEPDADDKHDPAPTEAPTDDAGDTSKWWPKGDDEAGHDAPPGGSS